MSDVHSLGVVALAAKVRQGEIKAVGPNGKCHCSEKDSRLNGKEPK